MNRITEKMINKRVEYLNEITNNPKEYMTDGKINIGYYHVSGCYGGWELHQTMNETGGIHVISTGGHITKRELMNQINCIINTIFECKVMKVKP
jgi:hypothetical protein